MRKYPYECKVAGCEREHASRGYCAAHYARWHRGVSIAGPIGATKGRQKGLKPRLKTSTGVHAS